METLKERIENKIEKDVKHSNVVRWIAFGLFSLGFTILFYLPFITKEFNEFFNTLPISGMYLVLALPLFFGCLFSLLTVTFLREKEYRYYDEYETKSEVFSNVQIKSFPLNKIKDNGDKYKINITTYELTGKPGNKDIEVDKWKVAKI